MDAKIRKLLMNCGSLNHLNFVRDSVACKICGYAAAFFDVVDLNKHCDTHNFYFFGYLGVPVKYYKCDNCEFLFTTFFDDWTDSEFSQFIYNADYIKVDPEYVAVRPEQIAALMSRRLAGCERLRVLDYGSGAGVFASRMREQGFSLMQAYDPFSTPDRPVGPFEIITCFEAIEHSPFPLKTFSDILSLLVPGGVVIFSQSLQPNNINEIRANWWYLGPRNGHVSTFSRQTLSVIAKKLGIRCFVGDTLHALAGDAVSGQLRPIVEALGPAYSTLRLFAPAEDALALGSQRVSKDGWHNIEMHGALKFRWTSSRTLTWPRRQFSPGLTRIQIDYINQIYFDFAQNCRIRVGASELPTHIVNGTIVAEIVLEKHIVADIELLTPEPRSPKEISGVNDDRNLGIAIRGYEEQGDND